MQAYDYPHVSSDRDICGGSPCIAGSRIPVRTIAAYHNMAVTVEQLAGSNYYPWLTQAQIYAALLYYYDHKAEIDNEIEANLSLLPDVASR